MLVVKAGCVACGDTARLHHQTPGPTMMNFHDQNRYCHAERSEASRCPSRQTLRCAQGDNALPISVGKIHNGEGGCQAPKRRSTSQLSLVPNSIASTGSRSLPASIVCKKS